MANRFPLIIDATDNKIKEIPENDNLSLQNNNITGVVNITSEGTITAESLYINSATVNINGKTFNDVAFTGKYEDLLEAPVLFSGRYEDLEELPTLVTAIEQLTNVSTALPSTNQVLAYNTTLEAYEPRNVNDIVSISSSLNDLADVILNDAFLDGQVLMSNGQGFFTNKKVAITNIDKIDVTSSPPGQNSILKWNGQNWVPGSATSNISSINELADVNTLGVSSDPLVQQVLAWNGNTWYPRELLLSDLYEVGSTTASANYVLKFSDSENKFISSLLNLDELGNVDLDTTAPEEFNVLQYDGEKWVPNSISVGSVAMSDLSDIDFVTDGAPESGDILLYGGVSWYPTALTFSSLPGIDLATTPPAENDVLTYNGTFWVPAAPTGGGGTGTVVGPLTSTLNSIPTFNSTAGDSIASSGVTIDSNNNIFTDGILKQNNHVADTIDLNNNYPAISMNGNFFTANSPAGAYYAIGSDWIKLLDTSSRLEELDNIDTNSVQVGDVLTYVNDIAPSFQGWRSTTLTLSLFSDFDITNLSNNQALLYDTNTTTWKNTALTTSVITDIATGNSPAENDILKYTASTVDQEGNVIPASWEPVAFTLSSLNDVAMPAQIVNGNYLVYADGNWTAGDLNLTTSGTVTFSSIQTADLGDATIDAAGTLFLVGTEIRSNSSLLASWSGKLTLGTTPTWTGASVSSGITVAQQSAGNYRITLPYTIENYSVMLTLNNTTNMSIYHITKTSAYFDVEIIEYSGGTAVDTGQAYITIHEE